MFYVNLWCFTGFGDQTKFSFFSRFWCPRRGSMAGQSDTVTAAIRPTSWPEVIRNYRKMSQILNFPPCFIGHSEFSQVPDIPFLNQNFALCSKTASVSKVYASLNRYFFPESSLKCHFPRWYIKCIFALVFVDALIPIFLTQRTVV